MSDARDLNRDGHVSLTEKVKDKLHLGHKGGDHTSTTYTTTSTSGARDLNHDGHISTAERLATGSHNNATAFGDPRDLNRDGHISTSEKLATSSTAMPLAGAAGARDLNRDGHISTT